MMPSAGTSPASQGYDPRMLFTLPWHNGGGGGTCLPFIFIKAWTIPSSWSSINSYCFQEECVYGRESKVLYCWLN